MWLTGMLGQVMNFSIAVPMMKTFLDKKDWLQEDGLDIDALCKVVFDRKLPDGKLSEFFHTGSLEVYHSSQLRWVPKRVSFSYLGMRARTQVAALHHNSNVGREQATTRDGSRQWKILFPKAKKRWVAKKKLEDTSNKVLFDLSLLRWKENIEGLSVWTSSLECHKVWLQTLPRKTSQVMKNWSNLILQEWQCSDTSRGG